MNCLSWPVLRAMYLRPPRRPDKAVEIACFQQFTENFRFFAHFFSFFATDSHSFV
jgi:hypothetical protein